MTASQAPETTRKPPLKVLLCSPRGFCAGVVRAIDTVEQALNRSGLKAGNNGYEAAVAAIEMATLLKKIPE